MSGLGVNDYSVEMSFVNEELKDDYEIIYIDRACYGCSDDTSVKQTVEQVVSDYRKALESARIEGVIFVDMSEVGIDIWEEETFEVGLIDYLQLFACKLGLQRLVLDNYFYPLPNYYSEDNQKVADYLNTYAAANKAKISELEEINNNTNKVYNSIVSNEIPKIYISSSTAFRTVDEFKEWEKEKIVLYINKLGNTKLILLPGNHLIFQEKPEELSVIIKDFITSLD